MKEETALSLRRARLGWRRTLPRAPPPLSTRQPHPLHHPGATRTLPPALSTAKGLCTPPELPQLLSLASRHSPAAAADPVPDRKCALALPAASAPCGGSCPAPPLRPPRGFAACPPPPPARPLAWLAPRAAAWPPAGGGTCTSLSIYLSVSLRVSGKCSAQGLFLNADVA